MENEFQIPPSIVPGRRGGLSVADAIVQLLWPINSSSSGLRIAELVEKCSKMLGYKVKDHTIRSVLYRHAGIFEKSSETGKKVVYRLTKSFMGGQHAK